MQKLDKETIHFLLAKLHTVKYEHSAFNKRNGYEDYSQGLLHGYELAESALDKVLDNLIEIDTKN